VKQFKGNKEILLQPADENISVAFSFPVKSSSTDGANWLPYGTTITSGTVTAYTAAGVDVSDDLIYGAITYSDYQVIVPFMYPTAAGVGSYSVRFVLTIDNDSTMEADFNRIICKDL